MERYLTIKSRKFLYITFGKGSKSLIMIQGLNTNGIKGSSLALRYMYRIFRSDYKVYLFERRPDVDKPITVRDMAQDIAEEMDALGIKCADVVGVSQGGMIAQYLAIDRPDLVDKLVLAVTLSRNNRTLENAITRWIELTEKDDYKALVEDMSEKMYSEEYLKRYKLFLPLLTLMQKPKDKARFINLALSCLTCSSYDELDRIKCPTLVIGGDKDKIVTGDASVEIAKKINSELYIYNELGHALYEEAKDFNKRVYDFLKR